MPDAALDPDRRRRIQLHRIRRNVFMGHWTVLGDVEWLLGEFDRLEAAVAAAPAPGQLTAAQIATVKFAAAVIEAELGGRRSSQAARDLRAMLPPDPVLQHQFDCPAPTRGGVCTCRATVDYARVQDHVAGVDAEDR